MRRRPPSYKRPPHASTTCIGEVVSYTESDITTDVIMSQESMGILMEMAMAPVENSIPADEVLAIAITINGAHLRIWGTKAPLYYVRVGRPSGAPPSKWRRNIMALEGGHEKQLKEFWSGHYWQRIERRRHCRVCNKRIVGVYK